MPTIQQVRDAMHTQPFRTFTVKLVDGQSYTVKHPDFISVPTLPRSRSCESGRKGNAFDRSHLNRRRSYPSGHWNLADQGQLTEVLRRQDE